MPTASPRKVTTTRPAQSWYGSWSPLEFIHSVSDKPREGQNLDARQTNSSKLSEINMARTLYGLCTMPSTTARSGLLTRRLHQWNVWCWWHWCAAAPWLAEQPPPVRTPAWSHRALSSPGGVAGAPPRKHRAGIPTGTAQLPAAVAYGCGVVVCF